MILNNQFRKVICASLLLLSGSLCPAALAQTEGTISSDYKTLQGLALKFFVACQELDWDTLRALTPHGDLEKLAVSKERLEKWSFRDRYDTTSPKFSRFNRSGIKASLRMVVMYTWKDWKTKQPLSRPGSFNFEFVKEDGVWKVGYFDSAAHDLLEAFLAAKDTDEEKRVLDRERELLDSPEINAVFDYFSGLGHKGDDPRSDHFLKEISSRESNPLGVTYALWWLGYREYERGDYREAEPHLKKAVKVAQEIHDTWLLASLCEDLANTYVKLNEDEQALKFHQQGLAVYLQDPKDIQGAIRAQRAFANAYFDDKSYEKARDHYKKGQALASEVRDREWDVVFIKDIGDTYYQQNDALNALVWYQKALDVFAALPESPLKVKDTLSLWEIHQSIGATAGKQKNFAQALSSFKMARETASLMKDAVGIISTFSATAKQHLTSQDLETALNYYTQMLEQLDGISHLADCNDCLVEPVATLFSGGEDMALVETFLVKTLDKYEARLPRAEVLKLRAIAGDIYAKRGKNAKAEAEFRWLLRQEGVADDLKAAITLDLATVYASQGQLDAAWKYLIQAEALGKRSADKEMLNFIETTKALLITAFLDNSAQSIRRLQELISQSTDKYFLSVAHVYLGMAYMFNDENDKALANAKKSLEYIDPEVPFQASLSSLAMLTMSIVYIHSGRYQDALEAAQRAGSIAERLNLFHMLGSAKAIEGLAFYKLDKLSPAREALARGIQLIEERRGYHAGGVEGAVSHFEEMITPYVTMLDVLYEMKDYGAGVNFIERSKARALLDILSGDARGRPPAEASSTPSPLSERGTDNPGKSFGVLVPLDVSGKTPLLSEAEIKSLLPDPDTALLQYAVTDEHIYLFLFSSTDTGGAPGAARKDWRERASWKAYRLNISKEALEDKIDELEALLSENRSGYSALCQQLYTDLLRPAAGDLTGKTSLIIIPDDVLWEVPFQALQPADDHFLMEDFVISYAPSMAVLNKMVRSNGARRQAASVGQRAEVLALADSAETIQRVEINPITVNEIMFSINTTGAQARAPVFNRVQTRRYATLKPLPGATDEVKRLVGIYGPSGVKLLEGPSLTKETFKRVAGQYRILHLATHGILDFQSPLDSGVIIGKPISVPQNNEGNQPQAWSVISATGSSPQLSTERWLLSAREVMEMRLRADLVVLSACETAGGGQSKGEGMVGLTWAFAAAGVSAVVASQWAVHDKATAVLMEDFHRGLRNSGRRDGTYNGTARALTEAARALASKREYRHPYYWAAFIVVGDGK